MPDKDNTAKIGRKGINGASEEDISRKSVVQTKILWFMVFTFTSLHTGAVIGIFLAINYAMWKTIFFAIFVYLVSFIGITAGGHRLWSHRAYKAKLPLRIALAFFMTITFQRDIYWWSRDHRVHHKFTETSADPYSIKRGFFFAHIGWLMVRKHPDTVEKGKTIDMSDLLADPVVVFQKKYYSFLVALCCFVLPTVLPMILWRENIFNAFFVAVVLRVFCSLHVTFTVNSFAHAFGNRPYSEYTEARENMPVNFLVLGEGFHNYHHTYPWDYAASEFGTHFSLTTAFINLKAWCGLAYDLRTVTPDVISKRKEKLQDEKYKQQKSETSEFNYT